MRIKQNLLIFCCLFIYNTSFAQISPPGLGKAKTASWLAVGLKRNLDSLKKKSALTYVGLGTISDPQGNSNPFQKQAILVLNHERYNHFAKHWQYSYALSYRRQNSFESDAPYAKDGLEQEFRLYGRISYLLKQGDWKWTNTWRQEFRKFLDADFHKAEENLQFRSRLKSQLSYDLGSAGQKLTLSAEALLASSLMNDPNPYWKPLKFKESRFAFYYSRNIPKIPISMDLGYMNDLIITDHSPVDVHYIALDLIWNLPFKKY